MRVGFRGRPWAGLDVGSYSVKLLARQSGAHGGRYWIAEAPIPRNEPDPERPVPPESVAQAIGECLSRVGISPNALRGISMAISGPEVFVKQIAMPPLEDREVGSALRFEARKHLPFDPEGMLIDFQILGRRPDDSRLDVLLAAVPGERVQSHLAPLGLLGVEPHVLDAAPLALTNAVLEGTGGNGPTRVLLDIGYVSSHLTLYQPGEPYFSRRLEFGGHHLTRVLAEAKGTSLQEAEHWKLEAGNRDPGSESDWESTELRAILACLRDELVKELRRSFAFYRTLGRLPEPLELWVSGGSARLPGLAQRLSELIETPVRVFNPLRSLGGEALGDVQPSDGPQFCQAFGLALRTS